jgi:hypothetical protein
MQHVTDKSSFCTTHKSSVSTGFTEQIMPILRILCYNGSLVISTVVTLTAVKFEPLIFYISVFALSYVVNMFILMILYDFCLSPVQFCCIIVYIQKVESCVQIEDRCALGKYPMERRNLFCILCNFKRLVSTSNSQAGKA